MLISLSDRFTLSESEIDTPIVLKIAKLVAQTENTSLESVLTEIQLEAAQNVQKGYGSPLYYNIDANAFESAAFNIIGRIDPIANNIPKLNKKIFYDLLAFITKSTTAYSPLNNVWQPKGISVPDVVFVPSPIASELDNSIKTAACYPNAKIVYNTIFVDRLLSHAFLKDVVVSNKNLYWYVSQGGSIPDYYAYVEFLIRHEYDHYSFGDHFYVKSQMDSLKKRYPTLSEGEHKDINNIVGDYIINYKKLQMGLPQLPMGLFSEKYNLSNFDSYSSLLDSVVDEYLKLKSKHGDSGAQDSLDRATGQQDDHVGNNDAEPSKVKVEEGKEGDGKVESEKDSMDERIEKASKKDATETKSKEESDAESKRKKVDTEPYRDSKQGKHGTSAEQQTIDADLRKKTSVVGWKQIFLNIIGKKGKVIDYSYRKPDSRSITNAQQTLPTIGTSVIKKGVVIKKEDSQKGKNLMLVIDTSGSFLNQLQRIMPDIENMFRGAQGKTLDKIFVLKFSNVFEVAVLNLKTKKSKVFKTSGSLTEKTVSEFVESVTKESGYIREEDLKKTLTMAHGSSTNFDEDIFLLCKFLCEQHNFTSVLFTDSDILDSTNLTNFEKFCDLNTKVKGRIASYCMFDSQDTYRMYYDKFSKGRERFIEKIAAVIPKVGDG